MGIPTIKSKLKRGLALTQKESGDLWKYIKALEQQPCEDCISRKAVIKLVEQYPVIIGNRYSGLIADIEHLSSVTPKARWIPVSENGYPKPENEYKHFITIDNKGEITIQEFLLSLDEEPQPYFTGMRNIVAYMPLPQPYKEDE